ncbi:MAG: hypothetical protein OXN95_01705 [bacterium]|nr:hypothetical protein [bacterium]
MGRKPKETARGRGDGCGKSLVELMDVLPADKAAKRREAQLEELLVAIGTPA